MALRWDSWLEPRGRRAGIFLFGVRYRAAGRARFRTLTNLRHLRWLFLAALAVPLFASGRLAAQTSGVWNDTTSGGIWSSAINWQSGNVADGSGASADFSRLTLAADNTLHLNSARSVGRPNFWRPGEHLQLDAGQ